MSILKKVGIFALALALVFTSVNAAELASDSHVGPTANFTSNSTSSPVNGTITFNASASRDSRGSTSLQYRWDFGDYTWSSWSSSPTITHKFTDSGEENVRLQVKDSDGFVDETSIKISIKAIDGPPVAKISVTPHEGDTSTSFVFTVEVFSQINTPTNQIEVCWDWDKDSKCDTAWSKSRTAYHTFDTTGYKEVWVQARDTNSLISTEKGFYMIGEEDDAMRTKKIGRILVNASDAPRASFKTWPVTINAGTNVHLDATDSLRAVSYRWDFAGDGTFDTAWSPTKTVQHVYKDIGVFSTILEVKNASGKTDRTTRTISVSDVGNVLPEAKFTVRNQTNSTAGNNLGVLLDEFSFSASDSKDADGSLGKLQTRWDFEGDGEWDTTFSVSKTAKHAYTETGKYKPTLQVLDEKGGLAEATTSLEIVGNTPPLAKLTVSPAIGNLQTAFRFDASGSRDDQTGTNNLEYRFDFDGDSKFETVFKTSRSETHTFTSTGKKVAVVEVRDHANALSRAYVEFEVVKTSAPLAAFSVNPTVGTFNTNFQFDAGVTYDPSLVGGKLSYRWDFDCHGDNDISFDTGWSSSSKVTHRYTAVGSYRVRLTVKNAAGDTSDFYQNVTVDASSPYFAYLKQNNILTQDINPTELVTRAELAQLIVKTLGLKPATPKYQEFTDVETKDTNAAYISTVVKYRWISPRSNFAFRPEDSVNRAEAVKIIVSALHPRIATYTSEPYSDVAREAWYARFVSAAYAEGILPTGDRFQPGEAITYGEAVKMVATLKQKYAKSLKVSAGRKFQPASLFASLLSLLE
jgi:PKD repeat protein